MYLRTGFGQLSAPPPTNKLLGIKRNKCQISIPCDEAQWQLEVPFRKDPAQFHKELRQAVGRRVTFRSDGRAFVDAFLKTYETYFSNLHSNNLTSGLAESVPIGIILTIKYTPGLKKELEITMP
jgi:hypothetical protein